MGVDGVAGATGVLLVTGGADHDGVLQCSFPGGIQGPHVEDVDTLHLSENLQTLLTGGLLEVGGDGTRLGTGSQEVGSALDVYISCVSQHIYPPMPNGWSATLFCDTGDPIGRYRLRIGRGEFAVAYQTASARASRTWRESCCWGRRSL